MRKDPNSSARTILLEMLREARLGTSLTQVTLSRRLGKYRSYVGKYETGKRSLDMIELKEVCHALGLAFPDFVARFERMLPERSR